MMLYGGCFMLQLNYATGETAAFCTKIAPVQGGRSQDRCSPRGEHPSTRHSLLNLRVSGLSARGSRTCVGLRLHGHLRRDIPEALLERAAARARGPGFDVFHTAKVLTLPLPSLIGPT